MLEENKSIIDYFLEEKSINPFEIFHHIVQKEEVAMHGPKHHIIDGACILTAYYNAGGDIDLKEALEAIKEDGMKIPGGICGRWGVCGAVLSVGAALAMIEHTGPLSDDGSWGRHMLYTSKAVETMGKIDGPRCCKRNGMVAISWGVRYINEHTNIHLERSGATCYYRSSNEQCIGQRCPFYQERV